jgi:predicted enzyme related to lactoylglutathione lyase
MPEMPDLPPGTPSWVDLGSADLDASVAFYSGLLGWHAEDLGPEAGHYRMCSVDGLNVAGIGPLMMEGQPPAWTTYVNVADADAGAAQVRGAGGTVLAGPMDVMDQGRMVMVADPTGAVLGLWQPLAHRGADLVNEPGSLVWNELNSRDPAAAETFYPRVFGWGSETNPMGDVGEYTEWTVDGRTVGGMLPMPAQVPAAVPSHWLVYFAVGDCDQAVTTATALGASVLQPPFDIPPGRMAVLVDPGGATFAVLRLASPAT